MLPRHRARDILARALGVSPEDLNDAVPLDALLEPLGARAAESQSIPGGSTPRHCELGYFLLAASIEDETGVDMMTHPQFERLLTRTVAEFIAAVELLLVE